MLLLILICTGDRAEISSPFQEAMHCRLCKNCYCLLTLYSAIIILYFSVREWGLDRKIRSTSSKLHNPHPELYWWTSHWIWKSLCCKIPERLCELHMFRNISHGLWCMKSAEMLNCGFADLFHLFCWVKLLMSPIVEKISQAIRFGSPFGFPKKFNAGGLEIKGISERDTSSCSKEQAKAFHCGMSMFERW